LITHLRVRLDVFAPLPLSSTAVNPRHGPGETFFLDVVEFAAEVFVFLFLARPLWMVRPVCDDANLDLDSLLKRCRSSPFTVLSRNFVLCSGARLWPDVLGFLPHRETRFASEVNSVWIASEQYHLHLALHPPPHDSSYPFIFSQGRSNWRNARMCPERRPPFRSPCF